MTDLHRRVRRLLLFAGVLADEPGLAWQATLAALAAGDAQRALESYARLFARLADEALAWPEALADDAWRSHLLDRLLADDNPLSRRARLAPDEPLDASLLAAARHDLAILQAAAAFDGERLLREIGAVAARCDGGAADLPTLSHLAPGRRGPARHSPAARQLAARLAAADDWPALLGALVAHYAAAGSGVFARYRAFRWTRLATGGELVGIAHPDPVTLDDLVGYDRERELLLRNTAHFLAGYPANNVLIYGDRGTGKSSTIKALLNSTERLLALPGSDGPDSSAGSTGRPPPASAAAGPPPEGRLRLIEVPKHLLADFPAIAARLRGHPERFVLFVDDLSFDEHETEYKELKALLEGGLEARPENVVLYATSNRRHIVQERFADRAAPDDEVHGEDAVQEKLSLGDRFGITLTFLAPDQGRYLAIVAALAARRGLELPADELRRRALQWAAWHNGRSGRCAQQFVDYLAGELGLAGRHGTAQLLGRRVPRSESD